jgi:hypothetical protein
LAENVAHLVPESSAHEQHDDNADEEACERGERD